MFVQLLKEWKGKSAGEKIDVPDDYASLLFDQQLAQVCDDPTGPLVAQAAGKLTQSLDGIVNLALKQFADAQSQARRNSVPAIFGTEGGRGERDPHRNFGDWLLHVARQDDAYLEKTYGSIRAKTALAESSGTTGGYIVPPEFYEKLLTLIAEEAIMRPRAFVQPMASASLMFPYLDVTTAQSAGTSPFFGGVIMNWTEEAQNRTETEPAFKQMELKAHELSGYAVSSNVLLQDAAFGLEKFLMTLFSKAIAWYEDYAFFQGNGVGKPTGILNAKATLSVTRNTGNSFKYVDAATMLSRLLPSSHKSAIWVVHPYVLAQLVQLADAANRIVWVPNNGGAQDKVPGTLFGLPVLTTEKVPALGTKGDVMLLDPNLYVIGDRMQIEIAGSEHVNFLKNQMTWRVVERVDGQPWLDNVITLQDGASTVSPFVVLN
jgi:HK97 family phage major capsid protein